MSQPPPPPPPPHGEAPKSSSGLPPGKYDIFVIPQHSAGSGFLYLPSLQPNVNSFAAGFACALIMVAMFQSMAPAFQTWWSSFQGMGNMGMTMLMVAIGVGAWALGRTQQETPASNPGTGPGVNPGGTGGGAGGYAGATPGSGAGTGPPPNAGPPPPPPPHDGPPPSQGPPPGSERPKSSWQRPPPQPGTTRPETPPKGAWEKAREETRRREEERKAKEEEQRRREETARKLREQREREAREREQREREARERRERLEAEKRERELREHLEKERMEREKLQKEREKLQKEKDERDRIDRIERDRLERLDRERMERERLATREKERQERLAREEKLRQDQLQREERLRTEQLQREEKARKDREEKERKERQEREAKAAQAEREARARELAEMRKREEEEANAARKASTYAFSGVGEKINPWPNGKPKPAATATSSPSTPSKAAPSTSARSTTTHTSSNAEKRPPPATARTFSTTAEEETYSYRPYDKPKQPRRKNSASSLSERSWAPSQTTARTTPPPSMRGPYVTKDPDKIVIKAVYLFMNQFSKTPASQLMSGIGSVTDGLILRITTEGLFIDDDVRGVPQREWDVKAWTLKQVEVWCPPHCLTPSSRTPGASKDSPNLLHKMSGQRIRDRGGTKLFTGEEGELYLTELLHACKDCCRLGLCESTFKSTNIASPSGQTGEWKNKGLHVLRATIRDQEGKRYMFVLDEAESWKVAVGLRRLRGGSQVRALGVSGMGPTEARGALEMLGWT